jgi:eukaryotic-like serine/threonine-protein kinase
MDDTAPRVIGRYQVVRQIGHGGMGTLFLARDPVIDRLLAIKVIRESYDSIQLRDRFAREARAVGRLRHPNIVSIFDVGEHEGRPFIAMEFIPGETLADMIRDGRPDAIAKRLHLIEQLCAGLAHAHKAGIVHRDVKPANLMVDDDGILQIVDFGIARAHTAAATRSGVLVGTLNYMSPEQVNSDTLDSRSDVFSTGAVAYELLSGRRAFPGDAVPVVLYRIISVDPEPLASVCPTLDPRICAIVHRALEKSADKRYQDIDAMRRNLSSVRRELEMLTPEDTAPSLPRSVVLTESASVDSSPEPVSLSPVDLQAIEAQEKTARVDPPGGVPDVESRAPAVRPSSPPSLPPDAAPAAPAVPPPAPSQEASERVEPAGFEASAGQRLTASRMPAPTSPATRRAVPAFIAVVLLVAAGSAWAIRQWHVSDRGRAAVPPREPVTTQVTTSVTRAPSPQPEPPPTVPTSIPGGVPSPSAVPPSAESTPGTRTGRQVSQPPRNVESAPSRSLPETKPRIEPQYARAEEAFKRGDYEEAIKIYQTVLSVAPSDQRARDGFRRVTAAKEAEERILKARRRRQ